MDVREELKKGLDHFQQNGKEMADLYKFVTGSAIDFKCHLCIMNAFKELAERYDDRVNKMKRGRVISNPFGYEPAHYTRTNTTDEIAIKLIELGYGEYFE